MQFENKIIWITGASSGIGEALVYAFDRLKAKVIISSRREAELERVKANCENTESIFILTLDLADHKSISEKADTVLEKYGKIDYLINNGGISQRSYVAETPLDIDLRIMDINYFGTVALTKNVLPSMIAQKSGYIITMSSLMGKFATPLRSAYAASKHALHGFFDALRAEQIENNIQVMLVCPGYIKTNVSINALTESGAAQNTMDPSSESGMLPEVFAKKLIKAIRNNEKEVLIGGSEIIAVYLKRFFPRLLAYILSKKKDYS